MDLIPSKPDPILRSIDRDSVLINVETDVEFIKDISEIAEKKESSIKSIWNLDQDITDEECDEANEKAILHQQANIFNSTTMLNHKILN